MNTQLGNIASYRQCLKGLAVFLWIADFYEFPSFACWNRVLQKYMQKKQGNRYYPKLIFSAILLECGRQQEQWVELFTDPAKLALEKYEDHPSIASIKNKMTSMDNLKSSFRFVSLNEVLDKVNKLKPKKAS